MPIPDRLYTLLHNVSKVPWLRPEESADTHSSVIVEIRSEPFKAGNEINPFGTQAEITSTSATWRASASGFTAFEIGRSRAQACLRGAVAGRRGAAVASRAALGFDTASHVVWIVGAEAWAEGAIAGGTVRCCYADTGGAVDGAGPVEGSEG